MQNYFLVSSIRTQRWLITNLLSNDSLIKLMHLNQLYLQLLNQDIHADNEIHIFNFKYIGMNKHIID